MRHAGSGGLAPAALETGRAAAAALDDHGRGLLGARGGFGILSLLLRLHEQTRTHLQKRTRISTPRVRKPPLSTLIFHIKVEKAS